MSAPTMQPNELSAEEQQVRAEVCFGLHQRIKVAKRKGQEAMWEMAEALHEFDEQNGWTALGGYEKLSDWLADPEVSMTRSTYYRLVSSYRELAVVRKVKPDRLADLDVSKVDIVLPSIKSGTVTLEKALNDVEGMGARDLREEYIKRPDPKDSTITAEDAREAGAIPTPDTPTDGATNPIDEEPVRASDLAHNGTNGTSGHLPDVEGTATAISEPSDGPAEEGEPPPLGDAVKAARDVLSDARRDIAKVKRTTLRDALSDLVASVEHAKSKGRL
jgi:hypothetical protein